MDPATDMYYYWLCTISIPVFYNLIMLVARSVFLVPILLKIGCSVAYPYTCLCYSPLLQVMF